MKTMPMFMGFRGLAVALTIAGLVGCGKGDSAAVPVAPPPAPAPAPTPAEQPWIDSFDLAACTQMTSGKSEYWILEPGFQIVLADASEQVAITVLDETKKVNGIETRVVEEREWKDGKLVETSRNYFTICKEHGDVFYHGEDVDMFDKNGKLKDHAGAWLAGEKDAKAGLMMPGKPVVGFRHYQEIAPGVALDRAEVVALDAVLESPIGEFHRGLKVIETTELEPGDLCTKIYAPGVGLVFDNGLTIIDSGVARKSLKNPMPVPDSIKNAMSEVSVKIEDLPKEVAAKIKELHPTGEIKEVKRESHPGGKEFYAFEVMIGKDQYDVEIDPDGKVLSDKKE